MSKVNKKSNLSSKIRQLREESHLSQEDMAEALDCSAQYLSLIENGHRMPSGKFIMKLASFFELSPGELFKDYHSLTAPQTNLTRKASLQKIINLLEPLSAKELDKIYKIITIISK